MLTFYLYLREGLKEEVFFTEGHPCYYARIAFNETITMYRKLFDIPKLQQIYRLGDYASQQKGYLKAILNLVLAKDIDNDFLKQHKTTITLSANPLDTFYDG
ncbi:hypothetical protein [Candidatus Chlamydia corallus]|uniref:hypothetical protein n=1 Tax=Candidatus Chlamydia corallus TaxID=2038470 RepID=UPI001EFD1EFF|nr:hypothetical protein [Candidatus Chlamydia corallus]